jgi:hypothetical protein
MRDAEKDLHMCGVDSGDSFIFNIVLPYWITRAQQLEARVVECEKAINDISEALDEDINDSRIIHEINRIIDALKYGLK